MTEQEELFQDLFGEGDSGDIRCSESIVYLDAPIEKEQDILRFWRLNKQKYLALARMARDVLAVPLASVAPERVFSVARDVISYRRCRLNPEIISRIMLAKYYFRQIDTEAMEETKEDDISSKALAKER